MRLFGLSYDLAVAQLQQVVVDLYDVRGEVELGPSVAQRARAGVFDDSGALRRAVGNHGGSVPEVEDEYAARSEMAPGGLQAGQQIAVGREIAQHGKEAGDGVKRLPAVEALDGRVMQHDTVAHAELVRLILRAREHPGGEVYAGDVQAALCQRQRVATGAAAKIKDAAHGRSGLSEEGFEEVAFRRVILIAVEAVILVGVVLGEGRHGLREGVVK